MAGPAVQRAVDFEISSGSVSCDPFYGVLVFPNGAPARPKANRARRTTNTRTSGCQTHSWTTPFSTYSHIRIEANKFDFSERRQWARGPESEGGPGKRERKIAWNGGSVHDR